MEKTVTFGIAAYNAQRYLEKCLSSFLEDSIREKIEVIVVNDGSSDKTADIVHHYELSYPDVFHLINQENKGHGGALNTAVSKARGIYFKAVDADDWVLTENLPQYVRELEESGADAVINGYHMVDLTTGHRTPYAADCTLAQRLLTMEELMQVYKQIAACCSFHGLTFRTETYHQANFRLTEKIFYEDNEYAIIPFSKVKKIWISPLFLYEYQIGNSEQSVAVHNQVKRLGQLETVILRILEQRKSVHLSPSQDAYYLSRLAGMVVSYYAVALVRNPDKRGGRTEAGRFFRQIEAIEPLLNLRTRRKYRLLYAMNRLGVSDKPYQYFFGSSLHSIFRRWWIR